MSNEPASTFRAINAIVDAISAHPLSEDICKHGLGALSTLAHSKQDVAEVTDVVDLVFSCMWIHSHSSTVQQGALAALSKIAIDNQTNHILRITPNDLDAILNAMRTHLYAKDVQENAVILLRSFMFCPANINVMGQNPFLVGLVKTAASNFQGSSKMNVEDLLRLLPSDVQ